MKNVKRYLLSLMVLSLWTAQADAVLEITISGSQSKPTPIAIVPFSNLPEFGFDTAKVVESDLVRSGFFSAIPRADMLEKPVQSDKIDFRNWRMLGVEHVVVGRMQRSSDGAPSVVFELVNVVRGERTMGYEIPTVSPDKMRVVGHKIADYVFEKLTGYPGYFNTQIAYVTASGPAKRRTYEMIVADADGENARAIARSREPIMSPAWSPDRRRLAYVAFQRGRSAIYIQDVQSGQARKFVSERGINGAPAWSPDGQYLACTMSFESNPDIHVINVATGERRRLTRHYGIDTEPAWAPDGRSLVFTSDRGGQPQIYQIDVNGDDNARRVTFQGRQNLRASFSPDGTKLALVNYDNSRYRIGLLDLKTRGLTLLSDGPLDESPSFAPNGVVIIYATTGPQGAELATVSTSGGVRQRLRQAGDVREPAWSPLAR